MKIDLEEKKDTFTKPELPCVMQYNANTKLVVLFTTETSGIVLRDTHNNSNNRVGKNVDGLYHYSDKFYWKPFKGKISIEV